MQGASDELEIEEWYDDMSDGWESDLDEENGCTDGRCVCGVND